MRFAEIALLAMPFVVFVAWRMLAPSAGPPKVLVIAVAVAVAAMAGLLVVLWYEDAEPAGATYVPARQEGDRIVPPHFEPAAPGTAPAGVPGRVDSPVPGQVSPLGAAQK